MQWIFRPLAFNLFQSSDKQKLESQTEIPKNFFQPTREKEKFCENSKKVQE